MDNQPNLLNETPTQPPSPVEPPSSGYFCCSTFNCKCNKLLYILAAFLMIVILSGVAYLYSNRNQPPTFPTPITKNEVIPNPTNDPTAAWKTYTYPSKTGETYEVKYPLAWSFKEASGMTAVDGTSVGVASVTLSNKSSQANGAFISIIRKPKSKEAPKTAADFTQQEINFNDAKDISINGIRALQISTLRDGGNIISIRYGNYDFIIQENLMGSEAENKEVHETFPLLTSTFKFTTPTDPTTNWKTYSSNLFTFEYPNNLSLDGTGDGCIYITAGLAYMAIKSPGGSIACGQTGRGSYDEITNTKETTKIGDKKYTSTLGNLVDMSKDPDVKTKYLEFFRFENIFTNDLYVEYGGYFNTNDREIYQNDKKIIYQILSTFKFIPNTTN